jgi:hypothetical protein
MALAVNLQDEAWNDGKIGVARASERTLHAFDALQAAIEQAMGQGEPIGTKAWFDPATGAVITQNLYPSDVYTTPQPQPCNPAEDGVCEALECCKHGVDDGACKECYHDTAAPQPQPKQEVVAEVVGWDDEIKQPIIHWLRGAWPPALGKLYSAPQTQREKNGGEA